MVPWYLAPNGSLYDSSRSREPRTASTTNGTVSWFLEHHQRHSPPIAGKKQEHHVARHVGCELMFGSCREDFQIKGSTNFCGMNTHDHRIIDDTINCVITYVHMNSSSLVVKEYPCQLGRDP